MWCLRVLPGLCLLCITYCYYLLMFINCNRNRSLENCMISRSLKYLSLHPSDPGTLTIMVKQRKGTLVLKQLTHNGLNPEILISTGIFGTNVPHLSISNRLPNVYMTKISEGRLLLIPLSVSYHNVLF